MKIEKATDEELAEIAAMSAWLKARELKLKAKYTTRRKPKEVEVFLLDRAGRIVGWA